MPARIIGILVWLLASIWLVDTRAEAPLGEHPAIIPLQFQFSLINASENPHTLQIGKEHMAAKEREREEMAGSDKDIVKVM